ncbi:DUF2752 domain-containing protein [Flavobacterium lacus]|uniref:Uncharacterized protein DUF2752 n=1 Tax=Flavobacterium lacus TaxID=1353778 RepID=A0A328WQ93_9FLAO|nr:DUF2752 domain-containing protein [Flavobacterium lacus]RAR47286.1 uncharacterized protein DUF2752 [Flavobacterium lacus]
MEDYMLPCLSKKLFGVDCFGCGIQRSFTLLLQGNFEAAFYMYPAIYSMMLFFLFIGISMIDKSRSYHKLIVFLGIITAFIMIFSYFYKLLYY